MRRTPDHSQPPQASASTNSATRAQLSFLDGVSQENAPPSSANATEEKFPATKNRARNRNLVVGNQNAVPEVGVYFLASADRKRVKIGKSTGVAERLGSVANMNAGNLVLVATVPGGYTRTEKLFHVMFAAQRRHGEWFVIDQSLRSMIKALCAGRVPASVLKSIALDRHELAERAAERARDESVPELPAPRPKPASFRAFKNIAQVVEHWKRAGGPTFEEAVLLGNPGMTDADVSGLGHWVSPDGAVTQSHRSGVSTLAHAMGKSTPTHRLYDLIWAGIREFSDNRRVRSRSRRLTDGTTELLVHRARTGGSLGHASTKYFMPGIWDCYRHCAACDSWSSEDGSADAIEELERVAHCVAAATAGWCLGIIEQRLHWRSCDCFQCQPDHPDHRLASGMRKEER